MSSPKGSKHNTSSECIFLYFLIFLFMRLVDEYFPEKAMAPHSSTLAWKIPWTEEPGRLQSRGLLRVGHDWATSLSFSLSCIGGGNGNPLQCSCLENPRDGGAWWAVGSIGSHRVGHDWSNLAEDEYLRGGSYHLSRAALWSAWVFHHRLCKQICVA